MTHWWQLFSDEILKIKGYLLMQMLYLHQVENLDFRDPEHLKLAVPTRSSLSN